MKHFARYYFFIILLFTACIPSSANDGAIKGVGGTVEPLKNHKNVRMVNEKITIKLRWDNALVKCRFEFKNEGPAAVVKMGFPEESSNAGYINKSSFGYFKSWVDNVPAKVKYMPNNDMSYYKGWHVKDVPFAKNQTRIVEDEYISYYGRSIGGYWWFTYILRTGKSWKDNITGADINIDTSEIASFWKAVPDDSYKYTQKGNIITFKLRNLEPKEDIVLRLLPAKKYFIKESYYPFPLEHDEMSLYKEQMLVPVSMMSELIDVALAGEDKSDGYRLSCYQNSIVVIPGSKYAKTGDGKTVVLPIKPEIKQKRLYVPIPAIFDALNMRQDYDKKTGNVIVDIPK